MANASSDRYYLPAPSTWPITGSIALGLSWFRCGVLGERHVDSATCCSRIGFAVLIYMMFGWFGTVVRESEGGKYNQRVDVSFRWGMSWFIFSEVMFFAAFFGALYYMRVLSVPWLGDFDHKLIWPDFTSGLAGRPGPGSQKSSRPMGAWGIPAINTMILLTSGLTVTLAHWALKKGNRGALIGWMIATVALGVIFLGLQAYEYGHAYSESESEADERRVRSHLLHAHGFSRLPCHRRHHHAHRDPVSLHSGSLHAGPSFRVSKASPGTGTSSTSYGYSYSSSSTGCKAGARRLRP